MGGARLAHLPLEREVGDARLARYLKLRTAMKQFGHGREAIGRVVVDGEAHVGGARRHDADEVAVLRGRK